MEYYPDAADRAAFFCGLFYNRLKMAYRSRIDDAAAKRRHYERNRQHYIDSSRVRNAAAIARNKKYVLDFLEDHPCVDCGEADPDVLQFDHVQGVKKDAVSVIALLGYSIRKLQAEMDKCEVRCANCHQRITKKRRASNKSSGVKVVASKPEVPTLFD